MNRMNTATGFFSLLAGLLLAIACTSNVQAETYFFHNDHLGTPQAVTDTSQQVVWQGEYDPFGEVTETVSLVEQNLRFPGQYFDGETGLHYNYFRDYDPSIGRYVESDPIGLGGGINTYAYVGSSPINLADPLGLSPPKPLPPHRTRVRACNAQESTHCQQICGAKGVQSCKVSQTWRINKLKGNLKGMGWFDGPMSCSCNDPDDGGFCSRYPKACVAGAVAGACLLLISPIPDDFLIPTVLGIGLTTQ